MWVLRTVLVASILMMLIPDSASKPQGIDVPGSDKEFLDLLDPGSNQGCDCVPIDKCADPPTEAVDSVLEIDPVSGAPIIEGHINPKNAIAHVNDIELSSCSGLSICCKDKKPDNPPVTTAPVPSPNTPSPVNRCGIRNVEGFRVTLVGTNTESQYGEFPWMVAVLKQGDNGYVAGGSLVHQNVVLTAAHKVDGNTGNLVARIGDWDLSETSSDEFIPAQTINVKKIIPHPDFQPSTLINNVALLILERDAELKETVMPICLPEPNQVFDGAKCTVTGWGKNELGKAGAFQKVLKKVDLPAVNHNECQTLLRNTKLGQGFTLHESYNCAGGDGADSCEGDGGSPLICPKPNNPNEYVQMGVVAWGIGCGIKGNPGVYGSVPKTVDWIKQIIKIEGGINPRG